MQSMRQRAARKIRKSIARVALGALLAGAAASHSQVPADGSLAWQIDTGG